MFPEFIIFKSISVISKGSECRYLVEIMKVPKMPKTVLQSIQKSVAILAQVSCSSLCVHFLSRSDGTEAPQSKRLAHSAWLCAIGASLLASQMQLAWEALLEQARANRVTAEVLLIAMREAQGCPTCHARRMRYRRGSMMPTGWCRPRWIWQMGPIQ